MHIFGLAMWLLNLNFFICLHHMNRTDLSRLSVVQVGTPKGVSPKECYELVNKVSVLYSSCRETLQELNSLSWVQCYLSLLISTRKPK